MKIISHKRNSHTVTQSNDILSQNTKKVYLYIISFLSGIFFKFIYDIMSAILN